MMHIAAPLRQHFHHLHPAALGEMGGDDFAGIFDIAAGGQVDGLRHLQHQVRLGDGPAFGPDPWWRRILSLARRAISIGPCGERGYFLPGERGVIRKLSHAGIREPGRHGLGLRGLVDGCSVGLSLRVRFERHGRNASDAVAFLAMALQNWQDITVERRRSLYSRGWRTLLRVPRRWTDAKGGAQKCNGARSWFASHPISLRPPTTRARFHLRRMASIFYNA